MNRPLVDIIANLMISVGGEDIHVTADGSTVYIDLPSLQAGQALTRMAPFQQDREASVRSADDVLRAGGLTAVVRHQGRPLAKIGAQAQPSGSAKLLQMDPVELYPARIASAATRERPLVAVGLVLTAVALLSALVYLLRD